MSSPTHQGRHYAGRHRNFGTRGRLPRTFTSSTVLPAVAAAALVVTATGATVAESTPRTLEFSSQQTAMARTEQASEEAAAGDLAARRQASALQAAAVQGRVEARARAARTAQRRTAAAAAARVRAERARARADRARATAEREAKRWVMAIHSGVRTSGFGPRWGRNHNGLDVGAPTGTPLFAMSKGTVILSENGSGFGNKVEIRYWDGTVSWYGHLSRRDVRTGDTVRPGDRVGLVGNTGHSFGSHLHIEIHPHGGDRAIDPYPWLEARRILPG